LKVTPISSPSSHNVSSLGRSAIAPQGTPLSKRKRRGRPQWRNTRRSTACTRPAETAFQYARGGNRRLDDGAAAFVGDAQPTNLPTVLQSDLVGSVHLPHVVGLLHAVVGTRSRPAAARCRYQPRIEQDALRAREQSQRFAAAGRHDPVTLPDVIVADIDVGGGKAMRQAQKRRRRIRDFAEILRRVPGPANGAQKPDLPRPAKNRFANRQPSASGTRGSAYTCVG